MTEVIVELDVPAGMRDGTILRANVYRPQGDGPWPTLLVRSPYGKDAIDPLPRLEPVQAARRGFMVVLQDTRGRFASDGEWMPFRHEREDGYDSVEWAARLAGSNGRVAMFGESYFGNTQWMAAVDQPPSLAAIAPTFAWSDPLDGVLARGGAVELGVALPWSIVQSIDWVRRLPLDAMERERRIWALVDEYDRLAEGGYWDLPVAADMPALDRHGISQVSLLRSLYDPQIASWCRVAGRHERVTVPSLHVAGWHDIFLQGTLDGYTAMRELGREARLIVGPWSHDLFFDPIGQRRFGLRASRYGVPAHEHGDVNDMQLAWFRRHLTDEEVPLSDAPVRIFVMGRNAWRDETSWPPARATDARWFLHAGGSVSPAAPGPDDPPSEFRYDPADPVPTVGGPTVMVPAFPEGVFDQSAIEARPDVLVFTSAALECDLEVTGRVRVVLHAASSAPSADWVARLCDVHPDGRSQNLCDGIVRVATGADALQRVEIDLWSTSNVFLAGHCIRVHVTSSSFPRWDRNLSTGDQRSPRFEIARQSLCHDTERPSYIELPVIA